MRKAAILFFISLILIMSHQAAPAQGAKEPLDPKKESLDLKKEADDIKFENGMQFARMGLMKQALRELNEYLEVYIHGIHRKEAFLKIARIHFDRYDYIKALKTYTSLYEEFSHTEEGVEAYFQMGICYQKMGYDDKAVEIFKSLQEDYPNSAFALQAKSQLELIEILQKK